MARINRKAPATPEPTTHGGGTAARIPSKTTVVIPTAAGSFTRVVIDRPLERLRRSVLACLLWEDEFYEDGASIAGRIREAAQDVDLLALAELAVEARETYNLRSVPMLLLSTLVERAAAEKRLVVTTATGEKVDGGGVSFVSRAIELTVQRADELTELLAVYWKGGKRPLTAQLKKGLARAFRKFDAYQLAKYDRANAIRLRDVLFLTHAKPKDEAQAALWKQLVDGTLPTPLTWETELSAGKDKRVVFEQLLMGRKIGYLALLRNLRNMVQAGVGPELVTNAILERKGASRVLPFRYLAAAKAAPQYEAALDTAMQAALRDMPKLPGKTVIIVDVSGSMYGRSLSDKSDLDRAHAAATLGAVIRGVSEDVSIYATAGSDVTRQHKTALVPPRHGMALIDAIYGQCSPLGGGGIFLTPVLRHVEQLEKTADRIVVVTDEQDCALDRMDAATNAKPFGKTNYLINVASYRNGIAYGKDWVHLTGFSENVVRFMHEFEKSEQKTPGGQADAEGQT